MNVKEVAAELNLAPFTVRQKCNKGKIAPAYKMGRSWVIEPSAIPTYRLIQRAQGANAPTRALIKKGLLPKVGIERIARIQIPKGMIAESIARVFTELDSIEVEVSKAPPQGKGEKKAQAVNLGRIQAIRDILYELKGSAVLGEIVRKVKSENN